MAYKVAYAVVHEAYGVSEGELLKRGLGGGTKFVSLDGDTGSPIESDAVFRIWLLLAKELSERKDLSSARRAYCARVFNIVRDAMLEGREP